ncbi:phosphotransferase family protein [Candidatus Nephthysia bennettiae]|uniref:Phosphotransferase family protein n=1 Tax=Candidatus Nephthysia bennettiae TaxID=3127016 RepID=A0A934K9I3_9BACT|nr:phosphotransferase family protein [Candidatus Dormibacteraeota bacterium]MBJ7613740.1 phosphotransferase family protein [Candidatus Dormibacteraeota bacterium]
MSERIRADLEAALGRAVESVAPIPTGHSGFTYWVDLEGKRAVMRLPPPGARIAGPADIPRQARLMDALHRAGLPVPALLAASDQPVVDGRPFYLVEAVQGMRIEQVIGSVPDREIARSAVAVLKQMQAIPVAETGIEDEHAMGLKQEVERWAWLMDRAPAELTTEAPALAECLLTALPQERPPVMVHADYHYGNMLFEGSKIVALLDWEISKLGQPLLDLACLAVVARASRSGSDEVPGGGAVTVDDRELLEMYGPDADDFGWYLALTYYKYASIFGYNLMLHRRGKRPDPIYEERTTTIVDFIAEGRRLMSQAR